MQLLRSVVDLRSVVPLHLKRGRDSGPVSSAFEVAPINKVRAVNLSEE